MKKSDLIIVRGAGDLAVIGAQDVQQIFHILLIAPALQRVRFGQEGLDELVLAQLSGNHVQRFQLSGNVGGFFFDFYLEKVMIRLALPVTGANQHGQRQGHGEQQCAGQNQC